MFFSCVYHCSSARIGVIILYNCCTLASRVVCLLSLSTASFSLLLCAPDLRTPPPSAVVMRRARLAFGALLLVAAAATTAVSALNCAVQNRQDCGSAAAQHSAHGHEQSTQHSGHSDARSSPKAWWRRGTELGRCSLSVCTVCERERSGARAERTVAHLAPPSVLFVLSYVGIDQAQCEDKGCCWVPQVRHTESNTERTTPSKHAPSHCGRRGSGERKKKTKKTKVECPN